MLSLLSFLLFALLLVIVVVLLVGMLLLSKGVDLVRRLFGLPPKSRFRWDTRFTTDGSADDDSAASGRSTRTSDGVTIIDRRSPEQANKKIFAPDEGEYVDYTEN